MKKVYAIQQNLFLKPITADKNHWQKRTLLKILMFYKKIQTTLHHLVKNILIA